MAGAKKLVIGASGFRGSHVTHQLVRRGDDVRQLLRPNSSTQAIDDLEVERHYGDVFDDDALRTAMSGVDDVFYCVVDARAWLRDPTPVPHQCRGAQHVLDAAFASDLRRFVFTSSIATIGIPAEDRPATPSAPSSPTICVRPSPKYPLQMRSAHQAHRAAFQSIREVAGDHRVQASGAIAPIAYSTVEDYTAACEDGGITKDLLSDGDR